METENIIEFIPIGEISSPYIGWIGLLVLNLVFIAIDYYRYHNLNWLICLIIGCVDVLLITNIKQALKVTLFKDTGIFQYDYIDFWGNEKSTIIYLETAYFKYKADISKTAPAVMRLLIYNNYFNNQVAIKANEKSGFNRNALDRIVENIESIQNQLNKN